MHDAPAIIMEIQPFLTYGSGSQYKGSKWRIKGIAYHLFTVGIFFFADAPGERRCEMGPHKHHPWFFVFLIVFNTFLERT